MPPTLELGERPSTRRKCCGFTLIELMVVLTILVLCSVLIPLSINRMMPGRRVSVAAERIKSAMIEAQSQSIASGQPIRFQAASHAITIASLEAANATTLQQFVLSSHTTVTVRSSAGIVVDGVVMYPDGASSGGQIDVIDSGHQAAVVVSMLTGHISVLKEI